MINYFCQFDAKGREIVELLCATARSGLGDCYFVRSLSKQNKDFGNHNGQLKMSMHLRYIIIAQIGIRRWLRFHAEDGALLPDLWEHIWSRKGEVTSAGDLGLAVWAGVESGAIDCRYFAKQLANNWVKLSIACNAVELAWVVQGIIRFSQCHGITDEINETLIDAHKKLTGLYCPVSGLFARHSRRSVKEAVKRRIACFADQIYPILALANYGSEFNDGGSIKLAITVADTLCRLQGVCGQWWWHYDVKRGVVAEEYPVYSVHQDGMAPMAFLAVDAAAGTNHIRYVEKGLKWLANCNERNEMMIVPKEGVVWRDIHRREIGKMYRFTRGTMAAAGLYKAHRFSGRNVFGFCMNRDCRPYHLGWILYAWGGQTARSKELWGEITAGAMR